MMRFIYLSIVVLLAYNNAFAQCAATVIGTTSAERCGSGTLTLGAQGSTGSTLLWYATDTGNVPVGCGNSFITPALTDTATYYVVASTGVSTHGGPVSPNVGTNWGSTNLNSYMIFDVQTALTLQSVTVFPTASGSITVALKNSAGTVLQQGTYSITLANGNYSYVPLGGGGNTTIGDGVVLPLNFSIPAGVGYKLVQTDNNSTVVRNTAGVPTSYYGTATNGLTVTGNWLGSSTGDKSYWYNFYDWVIYTGDTTRCQSAKVPVKAIIKPTPALHAGGTQILCGSNPLVLGANNPTANYVWSTGATSPSINVTATGTYWVRATDATSNCVATDTIVVQNGIAPSVASISATLANDTYTLSGVDVQNATGYLWDFGDGNVSTDASPSHIYTTKGSFTVHLCVSNACYTDCEGLTAAANTPYVQGTLVVNITDINEISATAAGIKVYPVPANNTLNIQVSGTNAIQQVAIYNVLGQQVFGSKVNDIHTSVSTEKMIDGVYILIILTDKSTVSQRINITH